MMVLLSLACCSMLAKASSYSRPGPRPPAPAPAPRPPYVASEGYPVFWHVTGPNSSQQFTSGGRADVTKFGIKGLGMSYCGDLEGAFPSLPFAENASNAVNGGVPQLANMTLHLELTKQHIESVITDPEFDGLAIFDFEEWTPVFEDNDSDGNWHGKRYQDYSVALVKAKHPSWATAKVAAKAKAEFEAAATDPFVQTLRTARALRPRALWGFCKASPSGARTVG